MCALPARRLPARVADVTGGAILLGGCSVNATTLTLVFGLVRASEFDFVHRSARPAAAREHTALHRPHLRHNLSWVESVGLAVGLEGRHCNLTLFEHAALAVCPLHPSHLDVSDAREHNKIGHRDVVFTTGHTAHAAAPRATAVVRLVLEASATLRYASSANGNGGGRSAVWAAQPLYVPPCHRLAWPRLSAWAAAWRKAGFDEIVLHARDAQLCTDLERRATLERLSGLSCTPTPSAPGMFTDVPRPTDHPRDYLDQALLNMVGLVQARAAGYASVAFVDVDEQPPRDGAALSAALASLLAGRRPFASFFFHPSWCDGACPGSTAEFAEMMRSGTCDTSHLHGSVDHETVAKVIGVPSRMTAMRVHSAAPGLGHPHPYAGCLQHPMPVIERDGGECHANLTRAKRAIRSRRLRRV